MLMQNNEKQLIKKLKWLENLKLAYDFNIYANLNHNDDLSILENNDVISLLDYLDLYKLKKQNKKFIRHLIRTLISLNSHNIILSISFFDSYQNEIIDLLTFMDHPIYEMFIIFKDYLKMHPNIQKYFKIGILEHVSAVNKEIEALKQLTFLDLSYNNIFELRKSIGYLTELKILHLRGNFIENIPTEIRNLSQLTEIDLSENRLFSIPSSLVELTKLEILDLSHNMLKALPINIGYLKKLTILDLQNNDILDIPTSIEHLINLERLLLNNNSLKKIPKKISKLKSLETLSLDNNNIKFIPYEIAKLKHLTKFVLLDNPITNIPPEIIDLEDTIETINYLKIQYKKETIHIVPEVKLLLVGEGRVGKTSIRRMLKKEDFNLHENKTIGLEIDLITIDREITREHWINNNIRYNIWDFGGQSIYLTPHKCFFTHNSIYIFVCEIHKTSEENKLLLWLNRIKYRSNNSPIILVLNKSDITKYRCTLDIKKLEKIYNIQDIFSVSCLNGVGINELENCIEQKFLELQDFKKENIRIKDWYIIKKELEKIKKNYISFKDFKKICKKHNVIKQLEIRQISYYLHSIGTIIHFYDETKITKGLFDPVILNPNWFTQAIYKLFDSSILQDNNGIIKLESLFDIWKEEESYPEEKYPFLLSLMKEYSLGFTIKEENKLVIPELLPEEYNSFNWDNDNNTRFNIEYDDFFPESIIPQLIVNLNQYLEKDQQKKRIFGKNKCILNDNGKLAFVFSNEEEKKISIKTKNDNYNEFLKKIIAVIDKINKDYSNLDVEKIIMCNCSDNCKKSHVYELLEAMRKDNIEYLICEESRKKVIIDNLLYGINKSTKGAQPVDIINNKVKVVLFAANPSNQDQLKLNEEIRGIYEQIRKSEYRDSIELIPCLAVQTHDLLQALNQHNPIIVHFSGHGSSSKIAFQNPDGTSKAVTKDAITQMIKTMSDRIQLVIFNTCSSSEFAKSVVTYVDASIGMNLPIEDEAAKIFAGQFYSAIGFGKSIQRAFDQAKAALMLYNILEKDTPQLYIRDGIDPEELILVKS